MAIKYYTDNPLEYEYIAPSYGIIRDGADKTYEKVGIINTGERVKVTAINGKWAYSPDKGGWFLLENVNGGQMAKAVLKTSKSLASVPSDSVKYINVEKDTLGTVNSSIQIDPKNPTTVNGLDVTAGQDLMDPTLNLTAQSIAEIERAKKLAKEKGLDDEDYQYNAPYTKKIVTDVFKLDRTNKDQYGNGYEAGVDPKKLQAEQAPIEWSGEAGEAIKKLQKINAYDFIIQPDLKKEKRFNMFNRAGVMDPTASVFNTKEYVFFTKPDLHIFGNEYYDEKADEKGENPIKVNNRDELAPELADIPIFKDGYNRYRHVLGQLQSSYRGPYYYQSPFMNLLSNSIKSAVDLPAINAEETATASNAYGTTITYRDTSEKSDDGFEFNIEFEDNRYLEVYMLFKFYDEYERKKHLGIIKPFRKYTENRIIHDQFAIYKFLVAEDGETILYFAKYWGVYPKGVPRDIMNEITENRLRFTIPFKAQFVDDSDPLILADFMKLTNPNNEFKVSMSMPMYDQRTQQANLKFGMVPFITMNDVSDYTKINYYDRISVYKLRWIEDIRDLSDHRVFDNKGE